MVSSVKALMSDPIVWICTAVILVGGAFFVWALGKLLTRKPSAEKSPAKAPDDLLITGQFDDIPMPPLGVQTRGIPATPPMSKDVAERLENMTQRLAEMQGLLAKQAEVAQAASPATGSLGQGFSPETIDKLLKIIGNVIQQVDILQKSMASPGGTPAFAPVPAPAPAPGAVGPMGNASAAFPRPAVQPAPGPAPLAPGGFPPSQSPKI